MKASEAKTVDQLYVRVGTKADNNFKNLLTRAANILRV